MSSLQYDLAQRQRLMGMARSNRPVRDGEPCLGAGNEVSAIVLEWDRVSSRRAFASSRAVAETGSRIATGSFLSVVVPARNEGESLPQLIDEIAWALRPLCGHGEDAQRPEASGQGRLDGFEIVVVDDASTDRTALVLRDLAGDYPELRWLILVGNVGQSVAMVAGIRAARGDWIATLDADLQNDPADLARLWEALRGHDAALGWRINRRDIWSRRVIGLWANWVRNALLGQSIRDTGCSVRMFSREAALRLPVFLGMHRFLGSLLLRDGCRLVQVPVRHRPRLYGRSHYNLWNRSIQVVVDLLGVAWLLCRPVRYRVAQAWAAGGVELGRDGAAVAFAADLDARACEED
jgi:hypothetical protein